MDYTPPLFYSGTKNFPAGWGKLRTDCATSIPRTPMICPSSGFAQHQWPSVDGRNRPEMARRTLGAADDRRHTTQKMQTQAARTTWTAPDTSPRARARGGDGMTAYVDTPIRKVLFGLVKIKKTGSDKWQACCPAHDDSHPSLSIKECEDGRVLLHCWAGCPTSDVVAALGLSLADLFPRDDRYSITGNGPLPQRARSTYKDALIGVAHEAILVEIIASKLSEGWKLDQEVVFRLERASDRINDALSLVGGAS